MGLFVDALLLESLLLIFDLPLNLSYAGFDLSHKGKVPCEVGEIFGLAVGLHSFFEVLDIFKLDSKVVVRYAQGLVQQRTVAGVCVGQLFEIDGEVLDGTVHLVVR